ncbi:hypothetical protein P175DRAFT_0489765 [Aspergillus ochraceoroseus IBT 24754]|uniref:Glycosyl hydrolase family 92 domain-containing protein n=1 Tax=Aspergillus ochraceoroseus IBT 24754 TaxID=1392256 RepID=A0A2T5M809_9EURO|nr:uncharacterized protein P175DRAFT_0489765 [Aspergillus ochraceoroseus IBT 24754]PTU24664.1 hypothetical protein P175DRAFT_0489765 [Aspergillus ochraceoroseus IBT 24754]
MKLWHALFLMMRLEPLVHGAGLSSHVNLFLGTQNGGNNFPGVARPFGMVKLGPDLLESGTDSYAGYLPTGDFSGFSMMHEQGTGGAPKYGTVAQLPLVGNITDHPLASITVGRSGADQASVGYYRAQTAEGVVVELGASAHAGMYRYTFPTNETANVLIDVSHVLPSFRGQGLSQGYKGGNLTIYADGHYEGLGRHDDAEKYLIRSRNWRNHWNANQTSLGFSGFVVPRDANGFLSTNPLTDGGYWGDPYYEASSWAYSWGSVHDMKQMIAMMGGSETVLDRLNIMFTEGASGSSGIIFDSTNEPMFNIPYLYNYIDRQDLSVSQSRYIAKTYYNAGVSGLPGNSDAGAMQTWLLWNMIGLYPITGQTTFLIHSPWFDSLPIHLGGGKTLRITSTGGDGNGDSKIHVQRLRVNGRSWRKNWLTWEDIFAHGGTMEFELGESPSDWFTDLPR